MNNILSDLKKAQRSSEHPERIRCSLLVLSIFRRTEELLERKPLDLIMGVEEASTFWDLSPGTIKNICSQGRIPAKKVGRTWIVSKLQESPKLISRKTK